MVWQIEGQHVSPSCCLHMQTTCNCVCSHSASEHISFEVAAPLMLQHQAHPVPYKGDLHMHQMDLYRHMCTLRSPRPLLVHSVSAGCADGKGQLLKMTFWWAQLSSVNFEMDVHAACTVCSHGWFCFCINQLTSIDEFSGTDAWERYNSRSWAAYDSNLLPFAALGTSPSIAGVRKVVPSLRDSRRSF